MSFIPCFPSKNRRSRRLSVSAPEPRKVKVDDIRRAVHVVHCGNDSSDAQDEFTGLPREWKTVLKALRDETTSEAKRKALFKKMRKFPKPTLGKEMVIFKGGGKTELGKEELLCSLERFCEKGSPEDRYEILHQIGRGSFGNVFCVRDKNTLEEVALKQCCPEYAETAHYFYTNEMVVLSVFRHANIIQTFESFYAAPLEAQDNPGWSNVKVPYLIMELMDCSLGELLEWVYAEDSLEENMIAYVTHEILCGVNYLHRKGLFHRDLKSDNILLSRDGRVKVADFGLSERFACPEEEFFVVTGTTLWMAPEICRMDKRLTIEEDPASEPLSYNYKADLWSLGIVLIEILDGEAPHMELWRAGHKLQIKKMIVHGPPPRPQRQVSPEMDSVIQALLCKKPEERLECYEVLRKEIFQCLGLREDFAFLIQSYVPTESEVSE